MNHNKYNLKVGDLVNLDIDFQNTSQVYIKSFTPNKIFATIYVEQDDTWMVMTNRLTPITQLPVYDEKENEIIKVSKPTSFKKYITPNLFVGL